MDWINLTALWQIIVFGLIAGAGLPAVFALGLRALSLGARTQAGSGESDEIVGGNPAGMVLGGLCFLIVLAGIAGGIYFIVAAS
ncbi:MAG TPA: hypothetical protein VFW65_00260 [Pseudonocardiaceae bacterium]|nr:hypothetical protein [Pseudonocardiaceae bacterium]